MSLVPSISASGQGVLCDWQRGNCKEVCAHNVDQTQKNDGLSSFLIRSAKRNKSHEEAAFLPFSQRLRNLLY